MNYSYHKDCIDVRRDWLYEAERLRQTPIEDETGNPISGESLRKLERDFYRAAYFALCGVHNQEPVEPTGRCFEHGEALLRLARERIHFELKEANPSFIGGIDY